MKAVSLRRSQKLGLRSPLISSHADSFDVHSRERYMQYWHTKSLRRKLEKRLTLSLQLRNSQLRRKQRQRTPALVTVPTGSCLRLLLTEYVALSKYGWRALAETLSTRLFQIQRNCVFIRVELVVSVNMWLPNGSGTRLYRGVHTFTYYLAPSNGVSTRRKPVHACKVWHGTTSMWPMWLVCLINFEFMIWRSVKRIQRMISN